MNLSNNTFSILSKAMSRITTALVVCLGLFVNISNVYAQCPMCKAAVESNMKDGGMSGAGLNQGILYLFFTPFTIAAFFVAIWIYYHKFRKPQTKHIEDSVNLVTES